VRPTVGVRINAHARDLHKAGVPVVLAGDYNVVPTDFDIYPTKSYAKDALVQPQSRGLFQQMLDQGWLDAIRTLHPNEPMYTFGATCETAGRAMPGFGSITCS
jgi:exodeoxyribonuclease-3